MPKHPIWAGATLALLIAAVTACGGGSPAAGSAASPAASCVDASAPHHAYVVVQHLASSSAPVQKCVGFSGDSIDGQALMDRSGVEYQTQTFSFGKAVCQVDNEPQQYSQCFASSGPNWSLFVDSAGAWTLAQTGYDQVTLHDKEALGWRYTADASPAPPPLPKER